MNPQRLAKGRYSSECPWAPQPNHTPPRRANDQKGSGGNLAPMPPDPCSPSYPGMDRSRDVNLFAQEV